MNLPQDGIKLHRGNFTAVGQQIQTYLEDGKCFRMVLKPWRERRSLSQNALSHMWYSEISEYLISRGKTFATPDWVKDALKHTYLGYETKELVDVVTGEITTIQSLRHTSDPCDSALRIWGDIYDVGVSTLYKMFPVGDK